ncbi:DsbA family protein [Halobacillus litoralis]|uniref:DsbA family protein n=1 Tax=Halobacillus litoralis TaxID=45668 RepID=UPI0024930A45|nr:DsbA family protein [Halobacillus litoralis]
MGEQKKGSMKFIVLLTVFVIGLVTVFVVLDNRGKQSAVTDTTSNQGLMSTENQPTLGDKDAPVQIVEFGDYKCPSCKAWSDQIYPQLKEDYIDTGDASLSFINVLFHGQGSALASKGGEAVYQLAPEAFWDFNKNLFEEQPENHDEQWVTEDKLVQVAKNSVENLDEEKFKESLSSDLVEEAVNTDEGLVEQYGVEQTPTVMINGQILENPFDYEKIKSVIDEELEDK